MSESLWGEEFNIQDEKQKTKKLINKINKPKEISEKKISSQITSKKLTTDEKLKLVESEVYRILGSYKDNTIVINNIEDFHDYISKAIQNGIIAIDTETNNSLDPITCKLMGLCIYTEGEKNAYIPVNHIDRMTQERLVDQLCEKDIREELSRLQDTFIVMHNGKFDYQVIKCTCNLELHIDWDTMIGAKLLDENERSAGLKQQYIEKIDPSIEKYSIEELFEKLDYEIVDPNLFALYAATDAFMTYKLYQWQKDRFESEENSKLYNLAKTLEMPLVKVLAEMELNGMAVDQQYADLLSKKYHKRLDSLDNEISIELDKLKSQVEAWRLTADANKKQLSRNGKEGKSKSEQLEDPIKLSSPTQLAILFYDVLKCPQVSKKAPRGTGEDELSAISKKLNLKLCDLLIKRRELVKLLTTYIDVIPELAKRWPDGRVRTHFNQYGAKTGRLSSSDPINFQNIPAAEKTIRMLFKADDAEFNIVSEDNQYIVKSFDSVETVDGFIYADKLKTNDNLIVDDNIQIPIKNISRVDDNIIIFI